MMLTTKLGTTLAAAACALALAAPAARAEAPLHRIDEGLSLELTAAGLRVAANTAHERLGAQLQNRRLDDLEIAVPLLWRIKAEGITYSVKLRGLDVAPAAGALRVDTRIEDVEIKIERLRFENWLLPAVGTSCYDSEIHVGNSHDLPATATVGARIENGRVALDLQRFKFSLNARQYAASGPSECRGPFDVRDVFTEFVVGAVLAHARPGVQLGVHAGMHVVVPLIERELNDLADAKLPVTLPDLVVLPSTKLLVGFKPYELSMTPDRMAMKMSLFLRRDDTESLPSPAAVARGSALLGRVGLNPQAISALLATTMADGSLPIELQPETHAFIALLTNRENMASLLPDLAEAPLGSDTLRLFVRFLAPPVLGLDDASRLKVAVPAMEWRYQVLEGGEWRDYFLMRLAVDLAVAPTSADGKLLLKVGSGSITVSGDWAPGYSPRNTHFDQETAQAFFSSLVEILVDADEPVAFDLPALPLGGASLVVDGVKVDRPFLSLDLRLGAR